MTWVSLVLAVLRIANAVMEHLANGRLVSETEAKLIREQLDRSNELVRKAIRARDDASAGGGVPDDPNIRD